MDAALRIFQCNAAKEKGAVERKRHPERHARSLKLTAKNEQTAAGTSLLWCQFDPLAKQRGGRMPYAAIVGEKLWGYRVTVLPADGIGGKCRLFLAIARTRTKLLDFRVETCGLGC